MKRKLLLIVAVVIVVGVAVAALAWANLDRIVKLGIEKGGSLALGVPVRLKGATVSVRDGTVGLDGLTIGSPEGFSAPDMFSLDHASATVEIGSLRSDVIVVKDVTLDGPRVTLEFSGVSTNWGKLMTNLKTLKPKESKKKMRIGHLTVTNGEVGLAGTPLAGGAALPLPPVDLHDIGGSSEGSGASVRTVLTDVVAGLYAAIVDAAGKAGPSERLQKLGAAADAAGKATEMLKGLIEKKDKGR